MKKIKITALLLVLAVLVTLTAFAVPLEQDEYEKIVVSGCDHPGCSEIPAKVSEYEKLILAFERGEITEGVVKVGSMKELEERGPNEHQPGTFLYQRITYLSCELLLQGWPPTWQYRDAYRVENVYKCKTCDDLVVLYAGIEFRSCLHN